MRFSRVKLRASGPMLWLLGAGVVGCHSTQDTIHDAWSRWEASAPPAYTYVLQAGGGFGGAATSRVVVQGEAVMSATDLDTKAPKLDARTMGDLIADVLALTVVADSVEATFDPKLGYLKSVDGAWRSDATDDSFFENVTCFEESTLAKSCATKP